MVNFSTNNSLNPHNIKCNNSCISKNARKTNQDIKSNQLKLSTLEATNLLIIITIPIIPIIILFTLTMLQEKVIIVTIIVLGILIFQLQLTTNTMVLQSITPLTTIIKGSRISFIIKTIIQDKENTSKEAHSISKVIIIIAIILDLIRLIKTLPTKLSLLLLQIKANLNRGNSMIAKTLLFLRQIMFLSFKVRNSHLNKIEQRSVLSMNKTSPVFPEQ